MELSLLSIATHNGSPIIRPISLTVISIIVRDLVRDPSSSQRVRIKITNNQFRRDLPVRPEKRRQGRRNAIGRKGRRIERKVVGKRNRGTRVSSGKLSGKSVLQKPRYSIPGAQIYWQVRRLGVGFQRNWDFAITPRATVAIAILLFFAKSIERYNTA